MAASEKTAEQFKQEGNDALKAGDLDKAVDCYTKAIEIDPENAVLYSNRSAAYAKKNDLTNAAKDGQKVIDIRPEWSRGYSRKGYSLFQQGKYDEAKEIYEKGLKFEPESKQLKDALAEVKAKIEPAHDPQNPFSDPQIFAKLAMNPETRDFLQQDDFRMMLTALQRDPSSIANFMGDPRMMKAISVMLGIQMKTGDQFAEEMAEERAKDEQEKAKEAKEAEKPSEPEEPVDPVKKQAKEEKDLGNAAYKKKDFESALEHYDKAMELDPTDMSFWTNKAAVLLEMGDFDGCIRECEKAVEVGRENRAPFSLVAKAFTRMGNACVKQENWEDAIQYYDKSLTEDRTKDVEKRKRDVEKKLAEQKKKEYINPELSLEEKEKGNAFFQKGDFPSAMKHYSEAIQRNPDDAKLYSNRAACYTKLAEFRLGLADCEKCLELDPTFVKGYLRKAKIELALKEQIKAAHTYQKVLDFDPGNAEAKEGLRNCHMMEPPSVEEVQKRAMQDPEVVDILRDPSMQMILKQMEENPGALMDHLKNPDVAQKIEKLMEAGLLRMR
eukprot:m.307856 g.307856  ORF g.307856 m.307856 type:complete len:553 (+) comp42942_c0_seq1:67-1725(+)